MKSLALTRTNAEDGSIEGRYKNAIVKLNNKVKHTAEVEMQYDDDRGQKFWMCRDCRNEEKLIQIDYDTAHIFRPKQLHATRAGCLRCGADVTAQKGCTRCFPAR